MIGGKLWNIVYEIKRLNIDPKFIKFTNSEEISPYMELNFENMNYVYFKENEVNTIEVNPYFRYFEIFFRMFDENSNDLGNLRGILFNSMCHFLGELELRKGLTREDYYLDITVLTKLSELKKVINADMVEYFSVKLSFPNGNEFQESILDDMKDDRSGLEYREKSFPRSFMKGVSKLGKKLASFATMYGNVKMKYFDYDKGKFQTFILKNKPIESTIDNDEHLFTEDFIRDEIVKALNETRLIDSDD